MVQHCSFDQPIPNNGNAEDTIGSIKFRVFLTDSSTTGLQLSNVSFENSLRIASDCIASISDTGASFTYLYRCSEDLLKDVLLGVPFEITSIVPNPASSSLEVLGVGHDVRGTLFDLLGNVALAVLDVFAGPMPVAGLPEGTYYLRCEEGGFVETRKVVISR